MHEVFLQRLAAHPTLRRDHNFFVFLEYGQDVSWARALGSPSGAGGTMLGGLKPLSHQLHKWHVPGVGSANALPNITLSPCVLQLSVRGKNRKELLGGFLRNIVKSADEALITSMSGLKVTRGGPLQIPPRPSSPQQRSRPRVAVGGKPLAGAWPRRRLCYPCKSMGAVLLLTQYKGLLSGSLRRWMTSLSMRGPSCWSTTPGSGMPACGQTVSCSPTSVCRAQGILGSPPPLPGIPTPCRERREQEMPRVSL